MTPLAPAVVDALVARAKAVSSHAYCPYSRFPVGAAVLTPDGRMYAGCNVENASYGLSVCAERNAVFRMVADGGRRVVAAAVYTPTTEPTAPCGACRQVLCEFGPEAVVISACDGPGRRVHTMSELLPGAFGPASLG